MRRLWLIIPAIILIIFMASFVVDAQRPVPERVLALSWWPEANVDYIEINGLTTRYIKEGNGPNIVLLHTFSTEIGQFRNLAKDLSAQYTVWAFDLPGFGYSDLPSDPITANFYAKFVKDFLKHFNIADPILVGESIGGSLSLMLAADDEVSIERAIAINPIGYTNSPISRSSRAGALFTTALRTPVLSGFFLRIRNMNTTKLVLNGAVMKESSLTDEYLADISRILQRPEFSKAQYSFVQNSQSWVDATNSYSDISVPTTILWGEEDWSTVEERQVYDSQIRESKTRTIIGSGHFMTLDQPEVIFQEIISNAN